MNKLAKWSLSLKILPILAAAMIVKLIFHHIGWEPISLNPLFASLLAGTIFLLGFLISGVLSDFKESEKLPGEIAASLEALHDETCIIFKKQKAPAAREFLDFQVGLLESILKWLYKKERTNNLLNSINQMNDYFAALESLTQPNFLTRMKQEQSSIRKAIIRIHTIRETSFVPSAYAIVEILSFFLITGLIVIKIEPFYESVFFVLLVTFLVLYMLLLIKDLDDPFEYAENGEAGNEVSLHPLHNLKKRLPEYLEKNV